MITRRGFLIMGAAGVAAACTTARPEQRASTGGVALDLRPAPVDVDLGGVTVKTWAYGDQVPGPEIRLRKGETLRAQLTNALPADTTVHWHGLAIPNAMDGVPVLTQPAVPAGQGFSYEFVVPDTGTYWYHSHVGTQLDRGLLGAIVIEDPDDGADYDDELVVVLDDWIDGTGTDPDQVLANLRKTGMPAMDDAGPDAGITPTTPLGDDGGDVTYPYFLANGRTTGDPQTATFATGQRVRLRIINAGSDTVFRVGVPDHRLTVTHTDGFPVVPRDVDSVILGMGERVDAIIAVSSSVPVVAAAYRKDGYARLNIDAGTGTTVDADKFAAALRDMAPLDTATLSATADVNLPARAPDQVIDMRLAGPKDGYTWTINGKTYDPPDGGYAVRAGERVRIRYVNESKMLHPMHLHGHTFQVMGRAGDDVIPLARKDTVLVAPLRTVEIDIDTDNPGRWITHCHNTYHLEAGMATFLEYA